MTRTLSLLAPLSLVLLAACGDKAGSDTGAWWETDDGGSDDSGSDDDDDHEDDDDDYEDEEDEDDFEEDERLFWGELDGDGGLVGYFEVADGEVACDMEAEIETIASVSSCSACDEAYELTLGGLEVFEDEGGACAASGYDSLAGATLGVGFSGESLYLDLGDGFSQVEDGYVESEDGAIFFGMGTEGEDDDED